VASVAENSPKKANIYYYRASTRKILLKVLAFYIFSVSLRRKSRARLTDRQLINKIKHKNYVLDFRVSIKVGGCTLASNKGGVD
jgi:hypothetical protein